MLSNFAEKKETFFDLTKMNFLNSSKTHFFTFGQKMPFFSLYRFDQNKTRNNTF